MEISVFANKNPHYIITIVLRPGGAPEWVTSAKRQISMADDVCQPPIALMGKVKETDKLIQAETTETGQVRY